MSSGFGSGVRICPRQDLAELEAIHCIATLSRHFEISLTPNHAPVAITNRLTQRPDRDIEVCLKPRA